MTPTPDDLTRWKRLVDTFDGNQQDTLLCFQEILPALIAEVERLQRLADMCCDGCEIRCWRSRGEEP